MYSIRDWCNNDIFQGETFTTFEEAWDYILEHIEEDEDLQEYHVIKLN